MGLGICDIRGKKRRYRRHCYFIHFCKSYEKWNESLMTGIASTRYSGGEYTHRFLWRCVQKQLEAARSGPEGSRYFHLSAMVPGYFVFEAYINYLGETLDKDTWQKEGAFFSKEPYRGTEGKLKKLLELYDLPYPQ